MLLSLDPDYAAVQEARSPSYASEPHSGGEGMICRVAVAWARPLEAIYVFPLWGHPKRSMLGATMRQVWPPSLEETGSSFSQSCLPVQEEDGQD